jgi:hypothetical protein
MPDRTYVMVTSDFDPTGFMHPRAIIWPDGRIFPIEDVRAFRPADKGGARDRYTVLVCGKERALYFERAGDRFTCRLGRWFVET